LPAGPIPPNPAEIFHSEAFRRLLTQLGERYDRVILDSPPVGPVTDATILSTLADATLLVVRSHRTDREVARRSLRTLRDVTGNTILGAVMNDQRNHDRYGYPYYYTQPAGSEPHAPQPPAGPAS
jgi:Mrp family chromosome partitioning ATPase